MNNPVAKHARTFNLAHVHRDRTKFKRASKHDLLEEWLEEVEFDEHDWNSEDNKESTGVPSYIYCTNGDIKCLTLYQHYTTTWAG